ncbi:MAG: hypothetical protein WA872_02680 [Candidatus Sulfotelmatobacter sp.]
MRKLALTVSALFFLPVALLAGKNLADYPLHIQIVESHWHRHVFIRGSDFSDQQLNLQPFLFPFGEIVRVADGPVEGLSRVVTKIESVDGITILDVTSSPSIHAAVSVAYDLKTTLRDDVYVPGPDGAVTVSQQEYKAMEKEQQRPH